MLRLLGAGNGAVKAFTCALVTGLFLAGATTVHAAPNLTIAPLTWNIVGLDSNNPLNQGPFEFLSGARLCNTGPDAANSITVNYIWDTANTYVNISPRGTAVETRPMLLSGACEDFYFLIRVTRTPLAFFTTRRYHITASASNASPVSTPTPRELYVEKIISQNRNDVVSVTGPTNVYVGQTVNYFVQSFTATQGYEQLSSFLDFPNLLFRIRSANVTYSAPPGATNDRMYSNACTWDPVPGPTPPTGTYRSCLGVGKAGGNVQTFYSVQFQSAGSSSLIETIYDFSGSSYHYNADIGINKVEIAVSPPLANIQFNKHCDPAPSTPGSTITCTIEYGNSSPTESYSNVEIREFYDPRTAYVSASPMPTSGNNLWSIGNLAPGQYGVITVTLTVNNTGVNDGDNLLNRAEISDGVARANDSPGDPPGMFNYAEDTLPVAVPAANRARLRVTKTGAPDPAVAAGGTLTYTIDYQNLGPATSYSTVLTDVLPAGVAFVSSVPAPSTSSAPTYTWNLGNLASGASGSITVTTTVSPSLVSATMLTNYVTLQGQAGAGTVASAGLFADAEETQFVLGGAQALANLSITKRDPDTGVVQGGLLTYTISVSNAGPDVATGVVVTDTLGPDKTFVASSLGSDCTLGAGTVVCQLGDVAVGATETFTINVTVSATAPAAGTRELNTLPCNGTEDICNNVSVAAATTDPDPANNASDEPTDVIAVANTCDLSITKTHAGGSYAPGATISYGIVLSNAGPNATGSSTTSFVDKLPSYVTYTGSSFNGGGNCAAPDADNNLVCSFNGNVPNGGSRSGTITVTVNANAPSAGTETSGACTGGEDLCNRILSIASAGCKDPNLANNSTSVAADVPRPSANLSISKTDQTDPVQQGGTQVYSITVGNLAGAGLSAATNIVVTDTLPAGVTYVGTNLTGGCSAAGQVLTCDVGSLALGASITFTITASVNTNAPVNITAGNGAVTGACTPASADLCNSATVSAYQTDPTPANNTATQPTNVLPVSADLSLAKTDNTDPLVEGDDNGLVYTFAVTNNGPDAANNVVVTDTLPSSVFYLEDDSPLGCTPAVSPNTYSCGIGSIPNGQTVTFHMIVFIPSGAPTAGTQQDDPCTGSPGTDVCNTAVVSSSTPDPNAANNTAVEPTNILAASADLQITKSDLQDPRGIGDLVTYAIVVSNPGPQDAENLVVVDTIDSNTSYVSDDFGCVETPPASGTITCELGSMLAGGSETIHVTVQVLPSAPTASSQTSGACLGGQDICNNVAVSSSTNDPNPSNNSAQEPTNISSGNLSAIGDRLWLDENGDGVQDAGEDGLAGVTVELYDALGTTLITSTTTDTDGRYIFTNIDAGTFVVRVNTATLPPGLAANPTYDFDDGTTNPNAETTITVAAGVFDDSGDFGFNWVPASHSSSPPPGATGAIGDRIWNDADMDGIQDFGEAGIPGVTVRLLTDDNGDGIYGGPGDNPPLVTTTDASGNYIFDGIAPGAYVIEVDTTTLPAGYSTTPTGDPDGDGNSTTNPIVLAPGDVYTRGDFGYPLPGGFAVGSSIFVDADADGVRDPGEPGLAGVTISLLDSNGNVIASTVSDANGSYLFPGLPNGTYTVVVTDTARILADVSTNTADPDGGFDRQSTVVLSGADNLTQDFGFAPAGHGPGDGLIGDVIFLDRNTNGVADPGEGMQGVTVHLYDSTGTTLLATVITDANGQYVFGGLDPGATYVVRVNHASLPNGGTGFVNSVDPDGGFDEEATVDLTGFAGGITFDQDFGYVAATPNSIGGTVFVDRDGNGTEDDGAGGYQGVTVILRDQDGRIVGTTTTDASGNYQFDQLPDGTYTVGVSEAGNVLGGLAKSNGPNPGADNNSQGSGYSVTVGGGQADTTADFGYYAPGAAFGNFIFNDTDNDGIQDPGETGIAGAVITLTITYPNGDVTTVVTVSDSSGFYSFTGLLLDEDFNGSGPGVPTYEVTVATPFGFQPSPVGQGGDAQLDSNDPSGESVTVVQGVTNTTNDALATNGIDFGFTPVTDLQIVKVGPGGVIVGNDLTFSIVVTNNGPSDALDVVVADPDPAGLSFVSASAPCAGGFPCGLGTVPAGESRLVTATWSVPLAYAGPDPIVNVASVSTSTVDTDPTNDSDDEETTVSSPNEVDLGVVKSGPVAVSPGNDVTFSIQVTNGGPATATNVIITDPTPGNGVAFVSADAPCGAGFPCNIGNLNNGQSVTINATYSVPASYTTPNPVVNIAIVSSDQADTDPSNDSDDAQVAVGAQADLSLDKTGPATVSPGGSVVYTVTVTNDGPANAANVTVTDPTPAGLVFVSNTGGCTTPYPCSLGTVGSGTSVVITSTYSVPANYSTPNPIVNGATVSSPTPDPVPGNESDGHSTTVILADLSVAKSGPASVTPGNNVVFTTVVTNSGPSNATGVVLADPTPAGLTFVSNTGDCTGAFPCSLGTIPNGQSRTVTSTYSVPAAYTSPSPISNVATVSGAEVDPTPGNNSDNHEVAVDPQADLSVVKTGPPTATSGNNIVYTIAVTNNGPSNAQNVSVADPTPSGLVFVSNAGACTGTFPCSIGTVSAGQTRIITSTFSIPAGYTTPNPILNTTTVSSPTPDPNPDPTNNSSTASTSMAASADLALAKSDPGTGADRDSNFTYTIVVTNNGPSAVTGVRVIDTLDSNTTYVSDTGGCAHNAGTLTCPIDDLANGASSSFSITVHVSPTAPFSRVRENGTCNGAEDLCNVATVSADQSDPVPSNNSDSEPTNVTVVNLSVVKSDSGAGVHLNEDFAYTITVRNGGPNTATGVTVVDVLDSNTTYVADSGNCTQAPAGTLTCPVGTLATGETRSFNVTVHVAPTAPTAGTRENRPCTGQEDLCNTVTVSANQADASLVDNTANEPTNVLANDLLADLSITKTDLSSPVQRSAFATYTISVTNNGSDTATDARVVDTLASFMTFVGATIPCTEQPAGMVTCALGDVASGTTLSFDVIVHVDAAAPIASGVSGTPCTGSEDACNRASVNSLAIDPDPSDNVADVSTDIVATSTVSALSITKSDAGPEPVLPGSAVTYTIEVDNAGPDDATNVVVYDSLDRRMTYVSDTAGCTASSATDAYTVLTCPVGTIAAGGSASFDVVVTVAANAPVDSTIQDGDCTGYEDVCNDALVATASADFNILDNQDSEPTDISLSLTCNDGIVDPDEECDPVSSEICNNGVDDDGNGQVDCIDSVCQMSGFQSCTGNCLLTPPCLPILDDPAKLTWTVVHIHGRFIPVTGADPYVDGARFAIYNDDGEIYSVNVAPGQMRVRTGPTLTKWLYKNKAAKRSGGIYRLGIHQRYEKNRDIAYVFTIKAYGDMSKATLPNMTTFMYIGDDVSYLNANWGGQPGRWILRRSQLAPPP